MGRWVGGGGRAFFCGSLQAKPGQWACCLVPYSPAAQARCPRPRPLQTAVRLALPGQLGVHAVNEGKKAVARFSGL